MILFDELVSRVIEKIIVCFPGGSCADVGSPTCTHLVVEERVIKTVPVDIQGRALVVRSEVTDDLFLVSVFFVIFTL